MKPNVNGSPRRAEFDVRPKIGAFPILTLVIAFYFPTRGK